ncbi:MAG: HAD-IB family phosphatase [Candidatus Kapabacteria bacterium]|nr:HAD-IB family phosphatase [Candidatus Kapabacteria bacterium]
MRLHLFLDFDGTISIGDVGDRLVGAFGSFDILHNELLAGEFTVAEYYRRAIASFSSNATPEAVEEFVQRQELDVGFAPLLAWSRENSIPATVVSDGFDVYIRPLLRRELGNDELPIASNTLSFEGGSWKPAFPGASESCTCFCASCKRNVILSTIGDDDVVIYVGDGLSDACAVRYADVVFAKGTLAAMCTEEGIPHHTYRSLTEVLIILQRRMKDNDFPRRRQARLARKSAFESE